ncbi:MAG: DNA cytosine methyltransferase [Prolixibacteraceae bacterium]
MNEITAGDCLAGGGGLTEAMSRINGMNVKWVLNHDRMALRTNLYHHNNVKHYWTDFYKQDEHKMEPVDFLTAGIECTQFSPAKGGKISDIGAYMLGWELVRYLKHLRPLVIFIENVPAFKKWAPARIRENEHQSAKNFSALAFDKKGNYEFIPVKEKLGEEFKAWKAAICALGYDYSESIRNAADDGMPTRRVRYFACFTAKSLNMEVPWPEPTHNKEGTNGKKKWLACKDYINTDDHGESIFGRKFNPRVKKDKRKPFVKNSLDRFVGGIKKQSPEFAEFLQFIVQYYGNGMSQPLEKPLNTIRTKDCHALVTVEKKQFLQDYFGRDNTAHSLNGPANAIRTNNSKHLVTIEKKFMVQHYSGNHSSELEHPLPTITSKDHNTMVTAKAQFVSHQYNSNGNPGANNQSLDKPINALTTESKNKLVTIQIMEEKIQFIANYFNSSGNPETQNHGLDIPLGTILTGANKKALVTAIKNGEIDFDIKSRFLYPEELSRISTFPDNYFTDPKLGLSKTKAIELIGKAVPPEWALKILKPIVTELQGALIKRKAI